MTEGENIMALHKIKDFDPNYKDHFDHIDLIGFDLYAAEEKVGSVADMLVGENGNLRYLVVNTGSWIMGKKVLLPIGKAKFILNTKRVQAEGLSKTQVENLPTYDEKDVIDQDYEEKVRSVYRNPQTTSTASSLPVATPTTGTSTDSTYTHAQDSALYELNDRDHQNLKLYEERLIANKTRRKTGEVSVGKHIETEKATVAVPLDKERVVVERTTPHGNDVAVTPTAGAFQEGEVARIEVYEESADIRKEAFVREEVNVKKIVEKETVTGEEQLRRERIELNSDGKPVVRDDTGASKKI